MPSLARRHTHLLCFLPPQARLMEVVAAVASWPDGSASLLTQQQTAEVPWAGVLLTHLRSGAAVPAAAAAAPLDGMQPGRAAAAPMTVLGAMPPAPRGGGAAAAALRCASLACLADMILAQPPAWLAELRQPLASACAAASEGEPTTEVGEDGPLGGLVKLLGTWTDEDRAAAGEQLAALAYSLALTATTAQAAQRSGLVGLLQVRGPTC